MSSDEQCEKECPLCMEPLEIDDIDFYPCKCEYQICRFCWHRLRTDENGLCPACRQPYPENPVNFKPLSTSEVLKIKSEKKQKALQQRNKVSESRKHLSSYRVLQKNLVYVVGLSSRVADPEVLKKADYFGKYGKILKIAVGASSSANAPQSTSCTAYVTYARYEDALKAIQAVNNALLDGRTVRASLGTTKYCSSFLRGQTCHKPECMYLHSVADSEVSFTKDDMHLGRHTEYERKLIEATVLKDKGQIERFPLPTNFKRKHSHSNSRDRSGTLHTVSSTGALERNHLKANYLHQKQQSRTASKSRSGTPNFGNLSNALSSSEKAIHAGEGPEKATGGEVSAQARKLIAEPNDVSGNPQGPLPNGEPHCEHPAVNCSSGTVNACKLDCDAGPAEAAATISLYSGSRLSQWTSVEGESSQTANDAEHKDCNSQTIAWSDNGISEVPVYPSVVSPVNGFDWQRLLGLNLEDEQATSGKNCDVLEHEFQNHDACLPSHLSVQSDDELGFDPVSESVKGLADLLAHENAVEAPLQNPIRAPAPASSLYVMGQQFGWSSVTGGNDILRTPVDNSYAVLSDLTPVNSCSSSADYSSFSSLRFQAAGQPLGNQLHNPNSSQQGMNAFVSLTPKPSMLNSQFTDPPPTMSPRYAPNKYPQYNQNSALSPLANQLTTLPGTSKLSEWQEGLKALLPNVNVRFVPELNSAGYPATTRQGMTTQPSWATSPQPTQQMHNHQQQPSSFTNYYGQVLSNQSHQLTGSSSATQVPIMPLNSIAQASPAQWLLPPPGFSHISKR